LCKEVARIGFRVLVRSLLEESEGAGITHDSCILIWCSARWANWISAWYRSIHETCRYKTYIGFCKPQTKSNCLFW